jgi:hypothetical protein
MPWRRATAAVLGGLLFICAFAYADVTLRARRAYLEGEKYMLWNERPELKRAALDEELAAQEVGLREEAAREKWGRDVLDQRLALARFQRDERLKESSVKYAYVWYKTALDLFTPPESRWVKLCREKAPVAKALWKKELDAQKIPYQDFQLD